MEEEVRQAWHVRDPGDASVAQLERKAEASGRRAHARQAHLVRSRPKKALRPARERALAEWIRERYAVSVRKAIELGQFSDGGWYAKRQARDQSALGLRIREIAHARPRFGYERIHVMLRREGWKVNRKRVYRWYRFEGLRIRMRVRHRQHMSLHRGPVPQARRTKERWSMSFVYD